MIELRYAVFWVLICTVHLTVCYHVPYMFQSESTLCSCLNVKELLAWNRLQNLKFKWLQLDSNPRSLCTRTSHFAPVSSKDFLDIQATIECGFTLKRVHDMTRTHSRHCHCVEFSFSWLGRGKWRAFLASTFAIANYLQSHYP